MKTNISLIDVKKLLESTKEIKNKLLGHAHLYFKNVDRGERFIRNNVTENIVRLWNTKDFEIVFETKFLTPVTGTWSA